LALARKGLVRPDPSPSGGEDRFSFQHVLVRDAAYNAMPKELRAALHERLADLMDDSGPGRELDELLGYHVEQAYRYRHEVGIFDEHTKELRLRASELLATGGARALGRNDVHAALKLLERAVALRPDDDPAVRLRLDRAMALFLSGQLAAADDVAAETEAQASASGDDVGEFRARLLRARIATQMPSESADREGTSAELIAVAEEARPVFARAGDELALAEAWLATAWAQGFIRCHWAAMLEDVRGRHRGRGSSLSGKGARCSMARPPSTKPCAGTRDNRPNIRSPSGSRRGSRRCARTSIERARSGTPLVRQQRSSARSSGSSRAG
jgi:hypothetical protein